MLKIIGLTTFAFLILGTSLALADGNKYDYRSDPYFQPLIAEAEKGKGVLDINYEKRYTPYYKWDRINGKTDKANFEFCRSLAPLYKTVHKCDAGSGT